MIFEVFWQNTREVKKNQKTLQKARLGLPKLLSMIKALTVFRQYKMSIFGKLKL